MRLSLGRGAGARPLCGPPLRRSRARRLRCPRRSCREPERELSTMWCVIGMALSGSAASLTSKAESFHVGRTPGLTLAPAEYWSHLQTVDESPAIKHADPTPAVAPYAASETAIRLVVPVSAVTYTSLSPVVEYVAPTPDATMDETAPAIEHLALALDDTFAAPAPVTQYVAPAPSDTDTTPESMTEFVAPTPAVYYATPAPPIEFVTPSLVIEYSALAPSVTCFTPSPQLPLTYTMSDLITGVIVDTARSVNSQSPITDVGLLPHRSLVHFLTPRLCTEQFDLAADDSQDEGLADGMHSCELACTCRTATPHRVMTGCSARRWPVRRRGTCDARHTTQEHKENWTPTSREIQIMGGRIGLFVEGADYIETEGGTLEEKRLEYRELLGEMAIYEEDLQRS